MRRVARLDQVLAGALLGPPCEALDQDEVTNDGARRRPEGQAQHRGVGGLADRCTDNRPDDPRHRRQDVERSESGVLLVSLEQAQLGTRDGKRYEGDRHQHEPGDVIEVQALLSRGATAAASANVASPAASTDLAPIR